MKSQISWVNWGQDESKVLVCWYWCSEIVSKPNLQSCLLQGEKGSVLTADTCLIHIKGSFAWEAQWALIWMTVLEARRNLTVITASSAPWAFLKRNVCCLILSPWKQKDSQGAHWHWAGSLAKGAPELQFHSGRLVLHLVHFTDKIIDFHYEKFSIW